MKAYVYRSFTRQGQGGNEAGVVEGHFTEAAMQEKAHQLDFSETVFLLQEGGETHLRFFTPVEEVDLCGHALVAALKHLDDQGKMPEAVHTKVGVIKTRKRVEGYFMRQPEAVFGQEVALEKVVACFDLPEEAYDLLIPPVVVSTGLRDLFVGVKKPSALYGAVPHFTKIRALSHEVDTVGIHLYCLDQKGGLVRNFAPRVGIDEEAATGTSNGALAALLKKNQLAEGLLHFRQGDGMGSPSSIFVTVDEQGPLVGGAVVCAGEIKEGVERK